MTMIPAKLQSRKLVMALIGLLLPIIAAYVSDDVEMEKAISMSLAAIVAYLVSQGYVDGKRVEEKDDVNATE
jgi:hypothetical protein